MRQAARQSGDVALEPQRRPIPVGQVELGFDATGENLFELEAPLDNLVAPVISRLFEPGIFELKKMLDDVLAE